MNKLSIAGVVIAGLMSTSASATIIFDANVTDEVIFGSGNINGDFTVDQANGIELGLRGKLRHNAAGAPENTFNSNGDGTYSFDAGVAPGQSSSTAVWSYEWSINSNFDGSTGANLNEYTYILGLDSDPSLAVSLFSFDPINGVNPNVGVVAWDHGIGDNSTPNGGGTEATDVSSYSNLIANNNLAQNSWKPHWEIPGFDPTVDGTYDFTLTAFDGTTQLAQTSMQIIVGAGGAAAVPEPGTMAILLTGLLGLAVRRKRVK